MLCRVGEWDSDGSCRQEESPEREEIRPPDEKPTLTAQAGRRLRSSSPTLPAPHGLSLSQSHFCSITG